MLKEIEFRDGIRTVPEHVADLLRGMDTYTMTYAQAIDAAEKSLVRNEITRQANALIDDHFRNGGWR